MIPFFALRQLWDVGTGQEIARLGHEEGLPVRVQSVAFSPDGTRLATGSADETARLWDVGTGQEIARLEGPEGWVRSVAFSPDGTRLATGADDGTARLWAPFIADVAAESFVGSWQIWTRRRTGPRVS